MVDNIFPLQAEKGEWLLTPEGSLVKTNAKQIHKNMDDDLVTDYQPAESYIFSNDKEMVINKDFAKDIKYGLEYHKYEEGKSKDIPKELSFDKFLNKKENTIAEIVSNIAKTYRVMDDRAHLNNPFIRRANEFNKQTREKPIQIAIGLNELLKPEDANTMQQQIAENQQNQGGIQEDIEQSMSENQQMFNLQMMQNPNQMSVDAFKYGGKFVPKAQWGDALSGAASGAAAGTMIAPGIGTIIGGLVGGIGNYFISDSKKRKLAKEQAKQDALFNDIKKRNDNAFMMGNLSTLGKIGMPVPNYAKTDYTGMIESAGSEYDRIIKSMDSRRTGSADVLAGANNTGIRALAMSGANPTQIANALNNGQYIDSVNKNAQYYDQYEDQMRLGKLQYTNPFIKEQMDKNLNIDNTKKDMIYGKYMNGLNEFNSNYQNDISKQNQLDVDKHTADQALALANATEKENSLGRFNNTLTSIGGAYQGFQNNKVMNDVYKSYMKDGATTQSRTSSTDALTSNPFNTSNSPFGLYDKISNIKFPNAGIQTPELSFQLNSNNPTNLKQDSSFGVTPTGKKTNSGQIIFKDHLGRQFIVDPITKVRRYF
jgi:hypothetical protein